MTAGSLAPPSSEPGREDFRTALTRLIGTYALDVQAGRPAGEIARVMDEARVRFDTEVRDGSSEARDGTDWKARAEKAEAKLAAIRKRLSREDGSWIRIPAILAIIGSEERESRDARP